MSNSIDVENVNRVEYIGPDGRELVKFKQDPDQLRFDLQDNGRTLKILEEDV